MTLLIKENGKSFFASSSIKQDTIEKIGIELLERFKEIQKNIDIELSLGYPETQLIYDSLYNISFSLLHKNTEKVHWEYINFNYASNHFKEILPQLKEICNDNISEFKEFVMSIYRFLSTIISNLDLKSLVKKYDSQQNKYKKEDFKKRTIQRRTYGENNLVLLYVNIKNLKTGKEFEDWVRPDQYNFLDKLNRLINWEIN